MGIEKSNGKFVRKEDLTASGQGIITTNLSADDLAKILISKGVLKEEDIQ